jgi:hypothetical protein
MTTEGLSGTNDHPTLEEVVYAYRTLAEGSGTVDWDDMVVALTAREDSMADGLRLAGSNLGAMPEFVAEVIAQIGLGTPPSEEGRALLRQQFAARMAWLQEQFRQQGGQ